MNKNIIRVFLTTVYCSFTFLSNFCCNRTSAVSEEVEKWQNRCLEKCYPFVYVDCLYCFVKEELKSVKKAVYVVLGVNVNGTKDVLGIWISSQESASKWSEIFTVY